MSTANAVKKLVRKEVNKDLSKSTKGSPRKRKFYPTTRVPRAPSSLLSSNPQLAKSNRISESRLITRQVRERILPGMAGKSTIREFEQIMLGLVCPALHKTRRWADKFSSMQTSTGNPWKVIPAPWIGSGTNTAIQMLNSDMFLVGKRNAECNYIMYNPNANAATFIYQFYGASGASTIGAFTNTAPAVSWQQATGPLGIGGIVPLQIPYAKPTTAYQPHGTVWFAGKADGDARRRFFWLDCASTGAQSTIVCTFTNIAAGATVAIVLDEWAQDGNITQAAYVGSAANTGTPTSTITMTAGSSAYYAFSIICTVAATSGGAFTGNSSTITVTYSGSCSVYEHHCAPYYETNFGATDGIRFMGMSMMYTNTAQDIYKNGEITCYQAPQDTYWTDFAGPGGQGLTRLNSCQGKVVLVAKDGMYQWMQVTQPNDFAIQTYISTKDGVLYDSFWPLANQSAYLVMYIQVPISTGTAGYFTIADALEFQTIDPWREVSNPDSSEVEWDMALNALRDVPRTATNKLHLNDIGRALTAITKSILGGIIDYGPKAIKIAQMVRPLV